MWHAHTVTKYNTYNTKHNTNKIQVKYMATTIIRMYANFPTSPSLLQINHRIVPPPDDRTVTHNVSLAVARLFPSPPCLGGGASLLSLRFLMTSSAAPSVAGLRRSAATNNDDYTLSVPCSTEPATAHIGIYTTINAKDEFRNVSVTEVRVAGWAWALNGKQT